MLSSADCCNSCLCFARFNKYSFVSFHTVDDSAGVKAAVLLAPVGSYAGALREVAHRGRLHINDLHTQNEEMLLLSSKHSQQQLDTWSVVLSVNTEMPHFTHSLLQQLFQAVNVWSVPSLPLHHHTVSAERRG